MLTKASIPAQAFGKEGDPDFRRDDGRRRRGAGGGGAGGESCRSREDREGPQRTPRGWWCRRTMRLPSLVMLTEVSIPARHLGRKGDPDLRQDDGGRRGEALPAMAAVRAGSPEFARRDAETQRGRGALKARPAPWRAGSAGGACLLGLPGRAPDQAPRGDSLRLCVSARSFRRVSRGRGSNAFARRGIQCSVAPN